MGTGQSVHSHSVKDERNTLESILSTREIYQKSGTCTFSKFIPSHLTCSCDSANASCNQHAIATKFRINLCWAHCKASITCSVWKTTQQVVDWKRSHFFCVVGEGGAFCQALIKDAVGNCLIPKPLNVCIANIFKRCLLPGLTSFAI